MEEPTGINSQRRTNLLAGTESLRLLPRVGTAARYNGRTDRNKQSTTNQFIGRDREFETASSCRHRGTYHVVQFESLDL
jgi:hypothetical protein